MCHEIIGTSTYMTPASIPIVNRGELTPGFIWQGSTHIDTKRPPYQTTQLKKCREISVRLCQTTYVTTSAIQQNGKAERWIDFFYGRFCGLALLLAPDVQVQEINRALVADGSNSPSSERTKYPYGNSPM